MIIHMLLPSNSRILTEQTILNNEHDEYLERLGSINVKTICSQDYNTIRHFIDGHYANIGQQGTYTIYIYLRRTIIQVIGLHITEQSQSSHILQSPSYGC